MDFIIAISIGLYKTLCCMEVIEKNTVKSKLFLFTGECIWPFCTRKSMIG